MTDTFDENRKFRELEKKLEDLQRSQSNNFSDLNRKVSHNHEAIHSVNSNLPGIGLYIMAFIAMCGGISSCDYNKKTYQNTQNIERRLDTYQNQVLELQKTPQYQKAEKEVK